MFWAPGSRIVAGRRAARGSGFGGLGGGAGGGTLLDGSIQTPAPCLPRRSDGFHFLSDVNVAKADVLLAALSLLPTWLDGGSRVAGWPTDAARGAAQLTVGETAAALQGPHGSNTTAITSNTTSAWLARTREGACGHTAAARVCQGAYCTTTKFSKAGACAGASGAWRLHDVVDASVGASEACEADGGFHGGKHGPAPVMQSTPQPDVTCITCITLCIRCITCFAA